MIMSDTPSCGITCNRHSDESRDIIYYCNLIIVLAIGQTFISFLVIAITLVYYFELQFAHGPNLKNFKGM